MRNQAHRPLTESTAYGLVWFLISSLTVALAWQLLGLGQSVFVFFFFCLGILKPHALIWSKLVTTRMNTVHMDGSGACRFHWLNKIAIILGVIERPWWLRW